MSSRSTFCAAGPLSKSVQTVPALGGSARLTKREFGSMTVDQNSRKLLSRSRFFSTTCTGAFGHGNRSDSENDRWRDPRLGRRLPFAVDRREPAGIDRPVRRSVHDLEEILAEVEIVDEPRAAAGPGPSETTRSSDDDLLPRVPEWK